jgi:hypothetical protein
MPLAATSYNIPVTGSSSTGSSTVTRYLFIRLREKATGKRTLLDLDESQKVALSKYCPNFPVLGDPDKSARAFDFARKAYPKTVLTPARVVGLLTSDPTFATAYASITMQGDPKWPINKPKKRR